jgi:hypothetical protein
VLKQRGVRATLTSSVAGNLSVTGSVKTSKRYRFKSLKRAVAAGTPTALTLKLPSAGLKSVKKALAHHKKVKARIAFVVTTASGIRTTVHKTVTLTK